MPADALTDDLAALPVDDHGRERPAGGPLERIQRQLHVAFVTRAFLCGERFGRGEGDASRVALACVAGS